MALEFRRNGHLVSQTEFFESLQRDAINQALDGLTEKMHQKSASIVDPETGKHATVFVRRVGDDRLTLHTNGSKAFAAALELRLGLSQGEVYAVNQPVIRERLVYLAHATEDKPLAEPLAKALFARGIRVWYDEWEIGYGDSLRRKMEQGLGECTHFIVLLTETSVTKPWVNEEIDVGLLGAVEGTAAFIGLRHRLPLAALSPFLKGRLTPDVQLDDDGFDKLAGEIFGVSKRPSLGERPKYVVEHKPGSTWSMAARAVAEYFVRASQNGCSMDPQASHAEIATETSLPAVDVRLGILDLTGAGLLEASREIGGPSIVWPKTDLFVVFDKDFMEWDPEADARILAIHLYNLDFEWIECEDVASALGWPPRRFNPAVGYLIAARYVKSREYMGGGAYWPPALSVGDELLRFVRSL